MRQHLSALQADGWVLHREVRAGPGRPHHLYRLSPEGDRLFPRAYAAITIDLLAEAEAEDPEIVERMFERRRVRRVERAQERLEGKSLPEQVQELTRILDEDGYLAEAIDLPDGTFRIVEHNCAILAVAVEVRHRVRHRARVHPRGPARRRRSNASPTCSRAVTSARTRCRPPTHAQEAVADLVAQHHAARR